MTAAATAGLAASGIAVSVANPFWLLWWATIGAAYIATSLSLIGLALARGRRIMSRWAYRGVLLACGVFLLGLGGWFLASGFGYVF